jgi:hypothetical protein
MAASASTVPRKIVFAVTAGKKSSPVDCVVFLTRVAGGDVLVKLLCDPQHLSASRACGFRVLLPTRQGEARGNIQTRRGELMTAEHFSHTVGRAAACRALSVP